MFERRCRCSGIGIEVARSKSDGEKEEKLDERILAKDGKIEGWIYVPLEPQESVKVEDAEKEREKEAAEGHTPYNSETTGASG